MGGNFCNKVFNNIKRQLRSVFTSTLILHEPMLREPFEQKVKFMLNSTKKEMGQYTFTCNIFKLLNDIFAK